MAEGRPPQKSSCGLFSSRSRRELSSDHQQPEQLRQEQNSLNLSDLHSKQQVKIVMLRSAARHSLRSVAAAPLRTYATTKGPVSRPGEPAVAPPPPTEKSPLPAAAADETLASAEALPTTDADPTLKVDPVSTTPKESALSTRQNSLAEQFMDLSEVAPEGSSSSSGSTRTGARAKGTGSSSIEKKRKNLTRGLLLAGLVGTVGTAGWLGREWESEEEKMKMIGRSEDLQAVQECEEGGWKSFLGRAKIRGADYLDVSLPF